MKLLIGYDGSGRADGALEELTRAGLGDDVEAVVVTVAELWLPTAVAAAAPGTAAVAPWPADDRTAGEIAARACGRLLDRFPAWDVRAATYRGSPAGQLLSRAEEWHPDLLVVGASGTSRIAGLFVGSVAQRVVSEALCSVRVARSEGWPPGRPPLLLVAVDDSAEAERVVRAVARRTWPDGTSAVLLTAYDAAHDRHGGGDALRARLAAAQRGLEALLREAGLSASAVLRVGNPKHVVPEEARMLGAECVVMGSRGHAHPHVPRLGSVARAVVGRAGCSVEVVRAV